MAWAGMTLAFVGMWLMLGVVLFQVFQYVRIKQRADTRGEGWDEGL